MSYSFTSLTNEFQIWPQFLYNLLDSGDEQQRMNWRHHISFLNWVNWNEITPCRQSPYLSGRSPARQSCGQGISVFIKVSVEVQRNILGSSRASMSHRLDFIDQTSGTKNTFRLKSILVQLSFFLFSNEPVVYPLLLLLCLAILWWPWTKPWITGPNTENLTLICTEFKRLPGDLFMNV